MNGWVDGRTDGKKGGWVDEWGMIGGCVDRWAGERIDGG